MNRTSRSEWLKAEVLACSIAVDVVSNLEAQMARARALHILLTAHRHSGNPEAVPEIVRQLNRIKLLNDLTPDLLFSIDCALTAAHSGKGQGTAST